MAEEKCIRCGDVGQDRRTLWMACFYEMRELKIPFEEKVLFHAEVEDLTSASYPIQFLSGTKEKITLQAETVKCSGELSPQRMYTMRVCKRCRADWLSAIKNWFQDRPTGEDEGCGSGIFIRENGTNKEITLEEWDRLQKERGNEK